MERLLSEWIFKMENWDRTINRSKDYYRRGEINGV